MPWGPRVPTRLRRKGRMVTEFEIQSKSGTIRVNGVKPKLVSYGARGATCPGSLARLVPRDRVSRFKV